MIVFSGLSGIYLEWDLNICSTGECWSNIAQVEYRTSIRKTGALDSLGGYEEILFP